MAGMELRGMPASPGEAIGRAWHRVDPAGAHSGARVAPRPRAAERDDALAALDAAASTLEDLAATLPPEDADIVRTGALMALDPMLRSAVEEGVVRNGLPAPDAILRATDEHADAIAAVGDPTLAARADDVRSLGRRAAGLIVGRATEPPGSDLILLAPDMGPGDVAELAPALAGIAITGGGATAHAAIVARSLGIPMVTGADPELLEITDGTMLALDGNGGTVFVDPDPRRTSLAAERMQRRKLVVELDSRDNEKLATTTDGRRVTVLANVASAAELLVALRSGAEGVGLLRTELAFLEAAGWPDEQQHSEALEPILDGLDQRPAIVRVLDFGADKSPPFLEGTDARGLALLLDNWEQLIRQLRAILVGSRGRDVRILLPMVDAPDQVLRARELLAKAARELGIPVLPPLGSMVETPIAAANADSIAEVSEFLSIGTNDLTAATLGLDRFATSSARAHDPQVLRLIAGTVEAAHRAALPIEVCGEAASDPVMLPLLVGMGVDQVSVGAAQVGAVRRWIRRLCAANADTLARSTLLMDSAEEVERAMRPLASQLRAAEPASLAGLVGG